MDVYKSNAELGILKCKLLNNQTRKIFLNNLSYKESTENLKYCSS